MKNTSRNYSYEAELDHETIIYAVLGLPRRFT